MYKSTLKYKASLNIIKDYVSKQKTATPQSLYGILAVITYIPCIDMCYILKDLYGTNSELEESITNLLEFYRLDRSNYE